ncbi:hypothetical protein NON20_18875 [Synechocystis sp. B12]|nr:hypothetical protein NON20_18875 [Synechocystis sp. B12]
MFKEGAVLSLSGGLMPYAPYVGSLSGDRISNDRNSPISSRLNTSSL